MPRLTVDHKEGVFVDGLSNEKFSGEEGIEVILLGLVKQRVLWRPEQAETAEAPWCKSYEGKVGNPGEQFPWKSSGFVKPGEDDEAPHLDCAACPLQEWGSHPKRDNIPWCTEQHVFPIIFNGGPAVFTLQRSSMKSSKAYLTSFVRSKTPLYTARTRITLTQHKRGQVDYCTIHFAKIGSTEQDEWGEYAGQFRSIRDFLHTPHSDEPADEAAESSGPAKSRAADDDDLPY